MNHLRHPFVLSTGNKSNKSRSFGLSVWTISGKVANRIRKSYNENGKHSVDILHWNAGAKHWQRQTDELSALILNHNPDIIFISEASFHPDLPQYQTNIIGYTLIPARTTEKYNYSRLTSLVKDGINFKLLPDLMSQDTAIIWISLKIPGQKKMTIGGIYREQSILTIDNSDDKQSQEYRWDKIIQQWSTAARSDDCFITGDLNLDFLTWGQLDYEHENMVNAVKNSIETLGFYQLVKSASRFWPQTRDTAIDHSWTNRPDKILKIENLSRGASDHNVIITTVRTKYAAAQIRHQEKNLEKFQLREIQVQCPQHRLENTV